MPPEDSPLYPLYRNDIKPRTMAYEQDTQSIARILEPYIEVYPRLVRLAALDNFAIGGIWQFDEIPRHLQEFFLETRDSQENVNQPDVQSHPQGQGQGQGQRNELERLHGFIAHGKEEIQSLQSIHESELETIRKEREEEKFNHRIERKNLFNTIQEQEEEILKLKLNKDSELNDLEALKNEEINRLGFEKDAEIQGLRNLLAQKEREIKGLQSSHGAGLKNIQKFAHEIELHCKSLCETIRDQEEQVANLESSKDAEPKELETLKNVEINKLISERDSEIKRLKDKLRSKDEELTGLKTSKKQDINKLSLERDSEIKVLQNALQAKDEELIKLKMDSERRIQESVDKSRTRESEAMQLKTKVNNAVSRAVNKTGGKQGDEIDRLNAEIHRINAEYVSLRNQMRLQENTEMAEITIALDDINRLIEELGLIISERIEIQMEGNSSEKHLRTRDLLGLFGRVGSKSASKVKEDAYLLFEYAVQATVCDQLHTHLFRHFHPSIADDEKRNTVIMEVYGQMVYQEPQSVAGSWRRDTFNSISRNPAFGGQGQPDSERMHRLITEALSTLLGKIVGIPPYEIIKEYTKVLGKVIAKAEQLNRLLKGEVVLLGDFQLVAFPFGEAFRPEYMSEVNSRPKKPNHPEVILATIGLGLIKSYAIGGGRKPEEVVLRKAIVFGLSK
ncbi:hypothetical protein FRC11_008552 [Ceratobasidium sp. 423]|nr:hypothetical protein FRC11_008552 [Ceratobasidium sp. 423]